MLYFGLKVNLSTNHAIMPLEDGIPSSINAMAIELLRRDLVYTTLELELKDGKKIFESSIQVLDYLKENLNLFKPLDQKIPRTEFTIGLILLCALIINQTALEEEN